MYRTKLTDTHKLILGNALKALEAAQAQRDLVISTILAGEDVAVATAVKVSDDNEYLEYSVPDGDEDQAEPPESEAQGPVLHEGGDSDGDPSAGVPESPADSAAE